MAPRRSTAPGAPRSRRRQPPQRAPGTRSTSRSKRLVFADGSSRPAPGSKALDTPPLNAPDRTIEQRAGEPVRPVKAGPKEVRCEPRPANEAELAE
jgi:hypothetical protein